MMLLNILKRDSELPASITPIKMEIKKVSIKLNILFIT